MRSTRLSCALLVLSLVACGGAGNGGSVDPSTGSLEAPRGDETPASDEGDRVDTRRADHEAAPVLTQPETEMRPLVSFARIGAGDAEDGAGHVVHESQRIAVDVDAHAFPPRALDPVLTVSTLRFVHYTHPHPGTLRFTLTGASLLPLGAELALAYDGDPASRRVLVQSLTDADLRAVSP